MRKFRQHAQDAEIQPGLKMQVNYDEKNAKDGNDSEYSGHSNAEDESADEVQDADKPANKVGNMSQA